MRSPVSLTNFPGFALVRNSEPKLKVFRGETPYTFAGVINWAQEAAIPEVIEYSKKYAKYLLNNEEHFD